MPYSCLLLLLALKPFFSESSAHDDDAGQQDTKIVGGYLVVRVVRARLRCAGWSISTPRQGDVTLMWVWRNRTMKLIEAVPHSQENN